MPLTKKGKKIKGAMQAEYGDKKGESVFYASINAGKIKGAEAKRKRSLPKRGSGELSPLGQRVVAGYEDKYGKEEGHTRFEAAVKEGRVDRERMFKRSAKGTFSSRTG